MCWKSSLTFWEVAAYFQGRLLLNLQGVDFLSPNFSCQRRAPRSGIAVPKKNPASPQTPPKKTLPDQQQTVKIANFAAIVFACDGMFEKEEMLHEANLSGCA